MAHIETKMTETIENEDACPRSRAPWLVVTLLFLIAIVNYFDRQSLSVVAPQLEIDLHLSDRGYGHIVSLFLLASTVAYALSGFVCDALGTRKSMALFVGWWSLAEAGTAFATSIIHLGLTRFCLGLGEPGLWVAGPKAVGEILEKQKRGLAIGIYTLGATVGAVIAVPVIVIVTLHLPWRWVFLIDGAVGLLWVPLWLFFYRVNPKQLGAAPLLVGKGSLMREVLSRSKTWKLMIARGLTDPVWYFYLFWFPKYLFSARHLSAEQLARVGWIVYFGAGLGTLFGGLLSGWFIRRGAAVALGYRRAMLVSAVILPISPMAALVPSSLAAIFIASIIAMAHMAWLVNLTSTVVELFPPSQVGRATGFVAAGSAFGGMISSEVIASIVTHQGYLPLFFIMAILHPVAIAILWKVFIDKSAHGDNFASVETMEDRSQIGAS